MVTQLDRVLEFLRTHPGPQHRTAIAAAAGIPQKRLSGVMATAWERGLTHHVGSYRSGMYELGPGPNARGSHAESRESVSATPATQPVETNGSNGHQVLPETLNFHVVGLLSDNRIVLEFKKTKDVFVAKRIEV